MPVSNTCLIKIELTNHLISDKLCEKFHQTVAATTLTFSEFIWYKAALLTFNTSC